MRLSRFHLFVVVAGLGMGMTGALTAVYARALGASDAGAGLAVASISVSLLAVDVLGTRLVPRLDGRLAITLALAVFGLGSLASALAPSYGLMVGARAFQGIGAALFMTGGLHAAVRGSAAGHEGRAVGSFNMAFFLGVAAGPLVSGAVAQSATGLGGLRSAFAVCAAVNAGAAALCWLGLRPMPSGLRPGLGLPDLRGLGRPRLVGALALGGFGQALQVAVPFTILPLFATGQLRLGVLPLTLALSAQAVAGIAAMSVAGRLSDHWGRLRVLLPALGWGVLVLLVAARADGLLLFVLCCAAIGVTVGSAQVIPAAMVVDLAEDRSAGISGYRISADVGQLLGAAGAGALVGAAGGPLSLGLAAGSLLVAAGAALWVGETCRRSSSWGSLPRPAKVRRTSE